MEKRTPALEAITVVASVAAGSTAPATRPVFVFPALPLTRAVPQPLAQVPPLIQNPVAAPQAQLNDLLRAREVIRMVPATLLEVTQVPLAADAIQVVAASAPAVVRKTTKVAAKAPHVQVPPPVTAKSLLTIPSAIAKTFDPAVGRVVKLLHLDLATMSVPQLVGSISAAMGRNAGFLAPQNAVALAGC